MVLSDRSIRAGIEAGRIVIDPYDESMVQPSSIDVRVDSRFRVFHNSRYPYIDVRQPMDDLTELVYPVQWEEADDSHWHITLRCPNCEWGEDTVFAQDTCDRFDDELERGTDALTRDYKRLMTANLAEEIDRFAHALEVDGILPMDF